MLGKYSVVLLIRNNVTYWLIMNSFVRLTYCLPNSMLDLVPCVVMKNSTDLIEMLVQHGYTQQTILYETINTILSRLLYSKTHWYVQYIIALV